MSEEKLESENVSEENSNEEINEDSVLEVPEDEIDQVEPLSEGELVALVEAVVFASHEPISIGRIREVSGAGNEEVKNALEAIEMKFDHEESGLELKCVGGKYQFRTRGRFGSFIRELRAGRPRRLSGQALETLSIIAYRQPIVKSDVEKIRGVDATPTLKTLIDRKLIRIVGHQPSVGQPALYGTTDYFLKLFGMASLAELPSLRDVKELMSDPGEPNESDEDDTQASEQEAAEEQEQVAANS